MEIQTINAAPGMHGPARSLSLVEYLVYHYTSNRGDTARGNANYFSHNQSRKASAHYFVDDAEVIRSVAEDVVAWSVGGKPQSAHHPLYGIVTNSNSISIEMCVHSDGTIGDATIKRAQELGKWICDRLGIDPSHVHRHYDVNGKLCPNANNLLDDAVSANFKAGIFGGAAVSVTPAAQASGLSVDGQWGKGTTRRSQEYFGTIVDGYVSGQLASCKKYLMSCLDSSWRYGHGGSMMIRAMQKWLDVSADGYAGPATIKALQSRLGVKADGYCGPDTVRAWQQYLNSH